MQVKVKACTDSKLLKDKIAEAGLKPNYVCKQLGITQQSFRNKVDNITEFKVSEMNILCQLLKVTTKKEQDTIFFADESDLKSSI